MVQVFVIIGFICGGAILPIDPVAGEEPAKSNSPPEVETLSRSGPTPRYMPPQMKPSYRFPDSKPMPSPTAKGKINPDAPRGKAVTKIRGNTREQYLYEQDTNNSLYFNYLNGPWYYQVFHPLKSTDIFTEYFRVEIPPVIKPVGSKIYQYSAQIA